MKILTLLALVVIACCGISQFPNPGPPVRYTATEYQPLTIAGKTYRTFGVTDVAAPDPVNDRMVLTDSNGNIVK